MKEWRMYDKVHGALNSMSGKRRLWVWRSLLDKDEDIELYNGEELIEAAAAWFPAFRMVHVIKDSIPPHES